MTLLDLMRKIERNPANFLQSDCIFQLRAFLRGYIFSKNIEQGAISAEHELLTKFDTQLKESYGVTQGQSISVEELLTDHEGEKAFEKYFEIWSASAGGL